MFSQLFRLPFHHLSIQTSSKAFQQRPWRRYSSDKPDKVVLNDSEGAIICWHPETLHPYKCTNRLPVSVPETHPLLNIQETKPVIEVFEPQPEQIIRDQDCVIMSCCMFAPLFYYTVVPLSIYYVIKYLILLLWDGDMQLFIADKIGKKIASLKGEVVWITGASSGIGEGIALALAKNGVKLVLSARRPEELERVKKNCLDHCSGTLKDDDILVLPLDVLKMDQHQAAFDKVLEHFGQLDILVNNAGRSQRAVWEETHIDLDREVFELNVLSVINLSRIAVAYFLQRGHGHVAVTSSLAGKVGAPFSGSYTGSKHAVNGYFNSLRNEKLGKGLHISVLCPGPVYTNFLQEAFTDKAGEKFNEPVRTTDRRMTSERCGYLCAVALANKLAESWIAISPINLFVEISITFPVVVNFLMKFAGNGLFQKLRDSRSTVTEEQKKK